MRVTGLCLGLVLSGIGPRIIAAELPESWAFRGSTRPEVPEVRLADWPLGAIDQFILARLEERGLSPSPMADRAALIRRLALDVLGLPPSPEDVAAFVADERRDAYERLVDRVLASPRYGERWARHWLDVVRFAETNGFETNTPRKNAYHYRDYVIRALNEDRSYAQFVFDQLAGDTSGEDAATGFLVAGPYDQVKSPDIELTLTQRANELHDMVSTTSGAFLGLTVGCARCHNHKFDPISQRDYYSMTAVFAGVRHGERELEAPGAKGRRRRVEELRAQVAALDDELARFDPLANPDGPPIRAPVNSVKNSERFAPVEAKWVRFVVSATAGSSEPCIDELEVFTAGDPRRNVALATAGARATASSVLPNFAIHKLEHIHDGRYGNGRSWISNERGRGWVQIELAKVCRIDRIVWGRDREGRYKDRVPTDYRIEVAKQPGEWQFVAGAMDRRPYVAGAGPANSFAEDLAPGDAAELQRLVTRRQELVAEMEELTVPGRKIYAGTFVQPGPTHRLYRGDPMQKRETVAPGAVSSMGGLDLSEDSPEQKRREELARWITAPDNPLTARVIVNRLWHYHFGVGLVSTPSDFGASGARPTHPELLDWLAAELVARRWSLKAVHRLILLSSTYRQSSAPREEALAVDAGTRLLWRFPPRRLEAEPIRDSILAVSGQLRLDMGGPGYDVFEPNSNYVHVYAPKTSFGSREWRRMVYQFKPRMEQDATFGIFDCPDAAQAAPRRTLSTTPLQALNLLNSPFMLQQSELFAERLRRDAGTDARAQVRRAFQLVFGRTPAQGEAGRALKLVADHGLPALCRALYNASEFLYVR